VKERKTQSHFSSLFSSFLLSSLSFLPSSLEKDFHSAQYRLGSLYEKGIGVKKDIKEASKWFGKSAEKGNRNGLNKVSRLAAKKAPITT
jgi:TPR repeat protein